MAHISHDDEKNDNLLLLWRPADDEHDDDDDDDHNNNERETFIVFVMGERDPLPCSCCRCCITEVVRDTCFVNGGEMGVVVVLLL
jgi:hypothetical protein